MLHKLCVGISFIAVTIFSIVAIAEDAVKADPQHYTVEFENDLIRIIRISTARVRSPSCILMGRTRQFF